MNTKILFLQFFLFSSFLHAQFTNAQKDSVLNILDYPTSNYEINMTFNPGDYVENTENLDLLSEAQILSQLKNDPSDANIYRKLYYKEKNATKKQDYYVQAVNLYNEWINANPENVKAIEEAMTMILSFNDYELLGRYVIFALPRFPSSKRILINSIIYHLNFTRDFEIMNELIQKGLSMDAQDIEILALKSIYLHSKIMIQISKGEAIQEPDNQFTMNAMVANISKIQYKHLHYYNVCMNIYMKGMVNFMNATEEDNPFSVLNISKEDQVVLNDALKFFDAEIKKNPKNKASLQSSAGFIQCLLNNLPKAEQYYISSNQTEETIKSLEHLLLICFLQKKWKDCEKYLERLIVKKENNASSLMEYSSLAKIYLSHDINPQKEKEIIERVQKLTFNDDIKTNMLVVWYLKNKNIEKAKELLPKTIGIKYDTYQFVLAVLTDQVESAKKYFQTLLVADPEKKSLQRLKKQFNW